MISASYPKICSRGKIFIYSRGKNITITLQNLLGVAARALTYPFLVLWVVSRKTVPSVTPCCSCAGETVNAKIAIFCHKSINVQRDTHKFYLPNERIDGLLELMS